MTVPRCRIPVFTPMHPPTPLLHDGVTLRILGCVNETGINPDWQLNTFERQTCGVCLLVCEKRMSHFNPDGLKEERG